MSSHVEQQRGTSLTPNVSLTKHRFAACNSRNRVPCRYAQERDGVHRPFKVHFHVGSMNFEDLILVFFLFDSLHLLFFLSTDVCIRSQFRPRIVLHDQDAEKKRPFEIRPLIPISRSHARTHFIPVAGSGGKAENRAAS